MKHDKVFVLMFSFSGQKYNSTLSAFVSQYEVAKVTPSQQIIPDRSPIINFSLERHFIKEGCHHPGDPVCGQWVGAWHNTVKLK